jgi:hypothetical protein
MCKLCFNDELENISYLNCNNCPSVTKIPSILGLRYLQCRNCPSLTSILVNNSLQSIDCTNSNKIISISYTESLETIVSNNCFNLMYIPIVEYNDYDEFSLIKPFPKCNYLISFKMQKLYNNIYFMWKKYKFIKFINYLQVNYYSNPRLPYMKHYIKNKLYDDNNTSRLTIGYINKKNKLKLYSLKSHLYKVYDSLINSVLIMSLI